MKKAIYILSLNNLCSEFWYCHLNPFHFEVTCVHKLEDLLEVLNQNEPDAIVIDDYFSGLASVWISQAVQAIEAQGTSASLLCLSPQFACEKIDACIALMEGYPFGENFVARLQQIETDHQLRA